MRNESNAYWKSYAKKVVRQFHNHRAIGTFFPCSATGVAVTHYSLCTLHLWRRGKVNGKCVRRKDRRSARMRHGNGKCVATAESASTRDESRVFSSNVLNFTPKDLDQVQNSFGDQRKGMEDLDQVQMRQSRHQMRHSGAFCKSCHSYVEEIRPRKLNLSYRLHFAKGFFVCPQWIQDQCWLVNFLLNPSSLPLPRT